MAIIALHSAASGMTALSTQLDVISNNIANANNNGFKASRVTFEDMLYQYQQEPGAKNALGDTQPVVIAVGYGTRVSGTQLDMSQGSTTQTGRSLDVTIEGQGFFRVKTLPTQGDGLAYTRTGNFFVNDQNKLVLNSQSGFLLDPPISIPQNTTNITISQDGRVFATVSGTATPTDAGQIQPAGSDPDRREPVSAERRERAGDAGQSGRQRHGRAAAGGAGVEQCGPGDGAGEHDQDAADV